MYAHSHNTQVGPEDTLAALGQASAGPIFGGNPASYFSAPASALFGIFGGSPARLNGGSGSEAGGGAEAEGGGAEIGGVFSLKGRERILASDGVEVLLQTQSPLHVNGRHRPEVLFKALLALLLASAGAEAAFVSDFFRGDNVDEVCELFMLFCFLLPFFLRALVSASSACLFFSIALSVFGYIIVMLCCVHTHAHTHAFVYTHTHTRASMHACIHPCIHHACTHACIHTYIRAYRC